VSDKSVPRKRMKDSGETCENLRTIGEAKTAVLLLN
jgi:hypothetical protein